MIEYRSNKLAFAVRFLTGAAATVALFTSPAFAAKASTQTSLSAMALAYQMADGSRELRNAVDRLSRNPNDVDAVIDAGNAALLLNDPQGAYGFFARAEALDPRNARAKAGLASAMLGNENPYEALRLFDEALKLGMIESFIASDRGLAYDLVGDNISAQRNYEVALRRGGGDEVVMRYALSLGISGDQKQADRMLDPLLRKQDQAAWRTRAFILAINGDKKEAEAVATATMPANLARSIQPFLDYMPKLTKPQQAAAAHFGHFPKTANIGRPDPRNAQYASAYGGRRGGGADAGLIPAGEPLGSSTKTKTAKQATVSKKERRRPGRDSRASWRRNAEQPVQTRRAAAEPPPSPVPSPEPAQIQTAARAPLPAAAETNTAVVQNTAQSGSLEDAVSSVSNVPVAASNAPQGDGDLAGAIASVRGSANDLAANPPVAVPAEQTVQTAKNTTALPGFESLGGVQKSAPTPSNSAVDNFDLAASPTVQSVPSATTNTGYVPSVAAPAISSPAVTTENSSFASLMAGIEVPAEELKRDSAAVDISKITPAKPAPKPKPAPAKPALPENPARYWAQISIGNDVSRLPAEWRRLSRKAPDAFKDQEGWTTPLGKTNRVLAGPFDSNKEAQEFVNVLAKSDMGAFTWKSDEGEEIKKLPKK